MSLDRIFFKEAWIVIKDPTEVNKNLYFVTEGPEENSPLLRGGFPVIDQAKCYLKDSVIRRYKGYFITKEFNSDWGGHGEFYIRRNILGENPIHESYFTTMTDAKNYVELLVSEETSYKAISQSAAEETKLTNPKDVIGSSKLPLHLFPPTARAYGAIAFSEGALKYGRNNFREAGVKASIYYDALGRHMDAWFEGQECDPITKVPHLANAIACVAILIEATELGNLQDDRNYPGGYFECKDKMSPILAHLKELFKKETPRHYLIGDVDEKKET